MKQKELLLEFAIVLINVSTFHAVRASSLRASLTNLSDISSNVGLLIGNTLTNDSLASVPHVILPGHFQNTMTSSTPSSQGTTARGPVIKTTNTERETTSAVSSSHAAQQGQKIPSNISSFNYNTSQNSNNNTNINNYSNNNHSNGNNTNQNNTGQNNSIHQSNNTGSSTKSIASSTSGDNKDSITIGNTQSLPTTPNIQTTYIKTDPVTTTPTNVSTSKPETIISTIVISKTKPATRKSPSSTTTTTTKSTPTTSTLLTETSKTSSTTKIPPSTTKTTNQDLTTIEGNTEDPKQKENKPTPATGRTTPVQLANSTTKRAKTGIPNTGNKNNGSLGGEVALVGVTRTTRVVLTQPSSTIMDSKAKLSTKRTGDFLKVTSPVVTKQSKAMPIKTNTNRPQTNPAKGDDNKTIGTTTGKSVISVGKSTTLFISQRTTPKFLSATPASMEQSTMEAFTTVPIQSDGDKYWPVAMAITIGVPAIIVIGVTISVMNRKRLALTHFLTKAASSSPS
uniref:Probable serine/threonine-protein kinase nek3 isoform X2 n=1 Tax=Crassostrea virginica TaxID=6565 RepID=A0A8B8BJT0_CRAVI|nr:probable serine/threonine-protein kinase nek3 isoform X2 [Crassostrea virginica]